MAAEYWCNGPDKDTLAEDLAVLGMTFDEEIISEDFEVWPENWLAVKFFLKVQTQWRTDQGYLIGLDYNPLLRLMELGEIEKPFDLLGEIQVIESKIIELLGERSK